MYRYLLFGLKASAYLEEKYAHFYIIPGIVGSQNRRIIKWFGLEGTFKGHLIQVETKHLK